MAKVNYTGNVNLMKGAATAHKNYDNAPGMYAGLDKITKSGMDLMDDSIKGALKLQKEEKDAQDKLVKDFDINANKVLQEAGSLSSDIFDTTYDEVAEVKKRASAAAVSGNDKEYRSALREIEQLSLSTQDHKATRKDIATMMSNKKIGYSNAMLEEGGDELFYLNQVMANQYSKGKNKTGQEVYNLKDRQGKNVEYTNEQLKELYIPENINYQQTYGQEVTKSYKSQFFDDEAFGSAIEKSIGKDINSLRSALADPIGPGGLKIKDLLNKDLNLDKEILMSIGGWDENKNNIVDKDEKKNFIDAVVNYKNPGFNEDSTRLILKQKMTAAGKKKHGQFWRQKNAQESNNGGINLGVNARVQQQKQLEVKRGFEKMMAPSSGSVRGLKGKMSSQAQINWFIRNVRGTHNVVHESPEAAQGGQGLGYYYKLVEGNDVTYQLISQGDDLKYDDFKNNIDYKRMAVQRPII